MTARSRIENVVARTRTGRSPACSFLGWVRSAQRISPQYSGHPAASAPVLRPWPAPQRIQQLFLDQPASLQAIQLFGHRRLYGLAPTRLPRITDQPVHAPEGARVQGHSNLGFRHGCLRGRRICHTTPQRKSPRRPIAGSDRRVFAADQAPTWRLTPCASTAPQFNRAPRRVAHWCHPPRVGGVSLKRWVSGRSVQAASGGAVATRRGDGSRGGGANTSCPNRTPVLAATSPTESRCGARRECPSAPRDQAGEGGRRGGTVSPAAATVPQRPTGRPSPEVAWTASIASYVRLC